MLTPKLHGILDYITVLVFAAAPSLFSLSEIGATIAYVLAGVHLLMTVCTAFPLGVVNLVPFQLHGLVELVVGLVLSVGAWLAGGWLGGDDQLFFAAVGGVILLVWLGTKYNALLTSSPA